MNTFEEYERAALGTAIYPGQGGPLGLMYVALKGAGEAGEFAEHVYNGQRHLLAKEVGDELWYLAAKAKELGTSLSELVGNDIAEFEALAQGDELWVLGLRGASIAGYFAEQVGKAIRDDNLAAIQIDVAEGTIAEQGLTPLRRENLTNQLVVHLEHLGEKAAELGTTLSAIAAGNIAKLADRASRGVLGGSGDNR